MLVLSRYVDGVICIGDDVQIMVVDVDRRTGRVKLGISAPQEVPVHRKEVYDRIKNEERR